MRSTHTDRGETVIPAPIRARFSLGPSQRLQWIFEADGSIRGVLVDLSPVKSFRGMGRRGGSSQRLLAHREAEQQAEQATDYLISGKIN
jgi:bifunctional DNA-binding transcriptional regulator/antitoxin component of YhaV-PrlF toxin-antitoxin module